MADDIVKLVARLNSLKIQLAGSDGSSGLIGDMRQVLDEIKNLDQEQANRLTVAMESALSSAETTNALRSILEDVAEGSRIVQTESHALIFREEIRREIRSLSLWLLLPLIGCNLLIALASIEGLICSP